MSNQFEDAPQISDQDHELDYVARKFGITVEQVKEAKAAVGSTDRVAIYAEIERRHGN